MTILSPPTVPESPRATSPTGRSESKHLILLVRADPIICGHSTEARNLAEAAMEMGFASSHIVSYPIDLLEKSGLPLKPLDSIKAYSPGITVDRPEPIGNYKVLDQRVTLGISGRLVELLHELTGEVVLMDLYLVPHGPMVTAAVDSFRQCGKTTKVKTIAEAVGSDITNVVNNALAEGRFGAAQLVLANYLQHDLPVAVSDYTRQIIIDAGREVDAVLGTNFEERLLKRVEISYPAIDAGAYLNLAHQKEELAQVLERRGLKEDGYVMFLSRLAAAKGVDDLIHAYRASAFYGKKPLILCGNGPAKEELAGMIEGDEWIRLFDDVSDDEKGFLLHGCSAWSLPSKPRPEFVETFGIAVAEKMLAGGPGVVITTRTGGIPEASGGICLEHPAGDIPALQAALDEAAAMTLEERLAFSQRAQQFAMAFDRKQILQRLLDMVGAKSVAG